MAACDWHDEGTLRYLIVDFRGGDDAERLAVLQHAIAETEASPGRTLMLVHWDSDGLDMAFFKEVKDANRRLRHLDIRAVFLGLGSRGGALAALFNIRVGHERVRSFDDEGAALGWLREGL